MDADTANATIDPKLSEALKHWNDYASESGRNARLIFEAMTPVNDSLRIVRQVMESMQFGGWSPTGMPWLKPSVLFSAYQELTEIHLAAQEKESDCYIRFLTTTLGTGKQVAEAMQGASTPQQILASYLEAGLSIAKQYQADASEHASALGQIRSAYNIWLQRTLENLGHETEEEPAPTAASQPAASPPPASTAESAAEKDSTA
ncbi:hypothetical protein [Azorhizophilus paspali]|uniref:Uncharacterized protein n=1 Tax=Azorhizophilus paspali TaxID=69963 RepID=A0ABV6SI20_AZOPA